MSSNIQQPIAYGQSVGHISHHCCLLHSELLEQTQLQVRREVWVLFLLVRVEQSVPGVDAGTKNAFKGLTEPRLCQEL